MSPSQIEQPTCFPGITYLRYNVQEAADGEANQPGGVGTGVEMNLRFWALARPQRPVDASLIEALKQGDLAGAKRLLDEGANPNAREVVLAKPSLSRRTKGRKPVLADTALRLAVYSKRIELVELLLQKGADVNGRGPAGFTPLMAAMFPQGVEIAKLLLEHGAAPNQLNDYGNTALVHAANVGETTLIEILLDHGADINLGSGYTPLIDAISSGHEDAVRLLIARGADVNQPCLPFGTPLECAMGQCAMGQCSETIIALIQEAGGSTQASEAFRREERKLTRYWQERECEEARARGRDRKLTGEDQQVIETVLLDLRTYEGEDLSSPRYTEGTEIILINETAGGPGLLMDDQLNSELDDEQANDISLDIRKHLLQRNVRPFSLEDFRTNSPYILLRSREAGPIHYLTFREQCPHARLWTQIFLPGYSKSHDRAVLRFWFGPSSHGASGTYFLTKQDREWRVRWRDFAFYL